MKIAMIGTGYVGLVTGTCFAEMGNQVFCVDVNEQKIEDLNNGNVPLYEPGLEKIVKENVERSTLSFTSKMEDIINNVEVCFIAVGTPMGEDGSADLSYVIGAAQQIGSLLTKDLIVVDKSTVPVGTTDLVNGTIQKELEKRGLKLDVQVVSNPEFLKEGAAVRDFMSPDRIVIGSSNQNAIQKIKDLYSPFVHNHDRILVMDEKSAELTKYAANAMLATKISFMNEMANISERVGADINMVRIGIGSDTRIGYDFIYPGCGYGGSCFPKDVRAIIKTAKDHNYQPEILKSVEKVNENQKMFLISKIEKVFGSDLSNLTFAVWGLAFKPGTDDMRESPAIPLIKEIVKRGGSVSAYDPKALDEARNHYLKDIENVTYENSKYDAINNADALILVTEWKEFRSPDFDLMKASLKKAIIFDGRNQYSKDKLESAGFAYHQVGVA